MPMGLNGATNRPLIAKIFPSELGVLSADTQHTFFLVTCVSNGLFCKGATKQPFYAHEMHNYVEKRKQIIVSIKSVFSITRIYQIIMSIYIKKSFKTTLQVAKSLESDSKAWNLIYILYK